ncbi:MAG: hypothetical protein Q9167_005113 [Letrouitia subvulpina]
MFPRFVDGIRPTVKTRTLLIRLYGKPYLRLDCGLGEAPFCDDSNILRFVDIVKQKFHKIDLGKGPSSHEVLDLEDAVSTTADIIGSKEDIVVGAKKGYAVLNQSTGKLRYIKKVWDKRDGPGKEERMRCNDGAVDSAGRYWVGAMNDPKVQEPTNEGVLFRLDSDLTLHRMVENVTIPNGIGWSADDKVMFFIDSPTKDIVAFDFDASTGAISNQRVFFHVEDEEAVPDGFAIDSTEHIWVAICGGAKILKVSPQGMLVGEIRLPTRMISCSGFAGDNLLITSAEEPEPDRHPSSAEYAGSLFMVHVGVKGLPSNKFRMS